jgi:hypothetical protein
VTVIQPLKINQPVSDSNEHSQEIPNSNAVMILKRNKPKVLSKFGLEGNFLV